MMRPGLKRRAGANAGFLLAETLITFALSALVLAGLVASASVLMRATDRSVASVGATDDLGQTLGALRRDLGSLKRARWNGVEPQGFVFRGGPNSLFFAQDLPSEAGGRELRAISLREIQAGRGTALTRAEAHRSAPAAGGGDRTFGPAHREPTGPTRLRFRYLAEREAGGPAPRPVDNWPAATALPAAVIVEVVDAASTRLLFTDRIALRADGDIGCADKRPPKREDAAKAGQPGAGANPTADPLGAPPAGPTAMAPGATPPPGTTGPSLGVTQTVANKNEFCGRADKGVSKTDRSAGGTPLADGAIGGPGYGGTPMGALR